MPQMSPLGWAWISVLVVFVFLLNLVSVYFLFICSFLMKSEKICFENMNWVW